MKTRNRTPLAALALALGALAGCGGNSSVPGLASDLISLAGFAMKGTLQKAQVEAFAIKDDGTLATTAIARGTTDDQGAFTLTPAVSKNTRYVLVVTATNETRHVDEKQGLQALGSDFKMSAVAPDTGSAAAGAQVKVSLTPFSTQEVEAAKKETGGLSSANIQKAKAVVNELYGFDPVTVSQDDKALKVLLTAVSKMTQDGGLGCTAGADPTCVVQKLAAATSTQSIQLKNGDVDVSSQFKTAITATVSDLSATDASINSSTVANAVNKLACTGAACTPTATSGGSSGGSTGSSSGSTAIAAVKSVLNEILTDLRTMFSNEPELTSSSKGAINQQAFQFKNTVQGVRFAMDQVQRDFQALLLGIRYYQDVKNGAVFTTSGKSQDSGGLSWWYGNTGYNGYTFTEGCTLYQDTSLLIPATTKDNANLIGCAARYGYQAIYTNGSTAYTEWRHGFTLTPDASQSGKFSYSSAAKKSTWSCTGYPSDNAYGYSASKCSARTHVNLVGDGVHFVGSITAIRNASGVYTGGTLTGDLPPGFDLTVGASGSYGPDAVILETGASNIRYGWDLDVTTTASDSSGNPVKWTFGGNVAKYNTGTKAMDLVLKSGSFIDKTQQSAQMDLSATVYGSSNQSALVGALTVDTPVTDKSKTKTIPSKLRFVGALTNTPTGSATTSFLQGAVELAVTGYDNVDATQPGSATNSASLSGSFTGSVTAPNQPRLELVLSTSGKTYNFKDSVTALNLSFNRWSGDTKTRAVNLAITRDAPTAATPSPARKLTLSEASSGLGMSYTEGGGKQVDVTASGNKIGVLDTGTSLVTFIDGTLVSLDLWP